MASAETELQELLDECAPIGARLQASSVYSVQDYEAAVLRRIFIEARGILEEQLGLRDGFAQALALDAIAVQSRSGAFAGIEAIKGGLRRIRRRAETAAPESALSPVPASDRYVSISDNQREDVASELARLKAEINATNDAEPADREIALLEIAIFEETICQPRLATDLVQRFVDDVLSWIALTFRRAVIAEVAQRLIQSLVKVIQ